MGGVHLLTGKIYASKRHMLVGPRAARTVRALLADLQCTVMPIIIHTHEYSITDIKLKRINRRTERTRIPPEYNEVDYSCKHESDEIQKLRSHTILVA